MKKKKPYKKPEIQTEKIERARLALTCNGMTGGGKKAGAAGGCTILLS